MKLGFNKVDLRPIKPVHKFAPLGKGIETDVVRDELACKVSIFQKEEKTYVHLSCPYGEVEREFYDEILEKITPFFSGQTDLSIGVTHTHYSVRLRSEKKYAEMVVEKIVSAIRDTELKEYETVEYSYLRRFFDKVGQVRVSGGQANVFLETFCIYGDGKRIATFITYNSHPTTQLFTESYFSGAGPAVLMKDLEEKYNGEFFSYMIGAAGDVSTRFTRKGQSYEDMLELNSLVEQEVNEQLLTEVERHPLYDWDVTETIYHVTRVPKDMNMVDCTGELTEREKETLEIARKKHENQDISTLPTELILQRVQMGDHIFIYTPFELFSSYLNCIDLDKATLVNIGNGAAGYLSGPGIQKLSFEVLGETIGEEDKKHLEEILRQLSR